MRGRGEERGERARKVARGCFGGAEGVRGGQPSARGPESGGDEGLAAIGRAALEPLPGLVSNRDRLRETIVASVDHRHGGDRAR